MGRKRLDVLLCERGLCKSREEAQALVLAGEVWSGERRLEKAGMSIELDLPLEVRARLSPFVSRAGQKLDHALNQFGLDVSGKVCLDVGASTGGFTDCLLQRGARHVFAVDVGYGQLDQKLRRDPRVSVLEKTNARFLRPVDLETLSPLAKEIGWVVMDVSFISLRTILSAIAPEFPAARDWVLLFKPQFEVGREHVGKAGLVKSEAAVTDALQAFDEFQKGLGFHLAHGPEASPLAGKKSGNLEYLVHYERVLSA